MWEVLYEHYGLQVTGETLLDFVSLQREPNESHRQFFDRCLAHARMHLPKERTTVDGIVTGDQGETMSVSLMNFITMEWLRKTDPRLIDIVKLEYGKDLREGVQLAALVPRLAQSIDTLIIRHNSVAAVENIQAQDEVATVRKVKVKQQKSFAIN